jgi:hypothetical protein
MKYAYFFLSVVMVALSAVTHFLEPEDVQDGRVCGFPYAAHRTPCTTTGRSSSGAAEDPEGSDLHPRRAHRVRGDHDHTVPVDGLLELQDPRGDREHQSDPLGLEAGELPEGVHGDPVRPVLFQ